MHRRFFSLRHLGLQAGLWLIGLTAPARADLIEDWNLQAMTAIRAEQELSPEASRSLAMLHTAIYNAVEGIAGNHNLFTSGGYSGPSGTAPVGASMEAAAAAAAHTILQSLYPSLGAEFASLYSTQLMGMADGQAKLDGMNYGSLVANDILNWRSMDGASNASDPGLYTPLGTVGHWQPTAPNTGALPGWGNVTTFAVGGTAGYTGSLPGGSLGAYLGSAQYAADYNQVKELGSLASGTRTASQFNAAFFWAAGEGTVTTAGMWNDVAQTVAASAGLSLQDRARLYAAMNVAMADTAIAAWETKYDVDFWSPLLAIVNGDVDGNGATLGDENWTALLAELNSPAFFSDHSALSAAAALVLAGFVGDDFAFSLDSDVDGDGNPDLTRLFDSFSAAAEEAGMSQVWGGVSFGSGHTAGAQSGTAVGQYVLDNYFTPVPEPSGVLLVLAGSLLTLVRRRR